MSASTHLHSVVHPLAFFLGALFFLVVLLDAFQTIILPRRPVGRLRITRLFFLATWTPFACVAAHLPRKLRDQAFSTYGPLALLLLIGLWAALLDCRIRTHLFRHRHAVYHGPCRRQTHSARLRECFYALGHNALHARPRRRHAGQSPCARAGLSCWKPVSASAFVALVIGYVPVLYGAFSLREVAIALLDARAGSPPTAGELLLRHSFDGGHTALTALLADWERWCAEMLESHISYPILCYYRSQHDNQSWLSALTAILDTCALLITTIEGESTRQAQLTFAIARHTLVDLGHVFNLEGQEQRFRDSPPVRLPDEEFGKMCGLLAGTGFQLCAAVDTRGRLAAIRQLYEPHAQAMADFLCLALPLWMPPPRDPNKKPDQWTTVSNLRTPFASRSHQAPIAGSPRSTSPSAPFRDSHE